MKSRKKVRYLRVLFLMFTISTLCWDLCVDGRVGERRPLLELSGNTGEISETQEQAAGKGLCREVSVAAGANFSLSLIHLGLCSGHLWVAHEESLCDTVLALLVNSVVYLFCIPSKVKNAA